MAKKRFLAKYYLKQREKTILGFCTSRAEAIRGFKTVLESNGSSASTDIAEVGCSDTYHGKAAKVRHNSRAQPYFGFYYLPKWAFELVEEMNNFFKDWNIVVVYHEPVGLKKGILSKTWETTRELDDSKIVDYCYSMLFRIMPEKRTYNRKHFKLVFHHLQLYMHHIFRVASLSHGNYIDNNFNYRKTRYKDHPYPHFEYVLNKSYHTKSHGYTLCNFGSLSVKKLEAFNDYEYLKKIYKKQINLNARYGYRMGSKVYQSSLLKEIVYDRYGKFKVGTPVEILNWDEEEHRNAEIEREQGMGFYRVKFEKKIKNRYWRPDYGYDIKVSWSNSSLRFDIRKLRVVEETSEK